MINHTSGPWRVAQFSRVITAGADSAVIATLEGAESDRIGNARAIAAVPELIEALRAMMTAGIPGTLSFQLAETQARRALQKAGL